MSQPPNIHDGTLLEDRQEPLTWPELVMILCTGYGIRCAGGLDTAREQLENGGYGDFLAVPFGFPGMVRDLEGEGRIEAREDAIIASMYCKREERGVPNKENQAIAAGLSAILKARREGTSPAAARHRLCQNLDDYTQKERDIICLRFTDALRSWLKALNTTSSYKDAAFLLVRPNTEDVIDRPLYSGIGKVGKASIKSEDMWREVLVFPTEKENDGLGERYARQALVGLLQFYQQIP